MKKIWDLIKLDIITMNGGKNTLTIALVVMVLFIAGIGFVFTPLFGLYCPLIVGGFFVPVVFRNEMKYHSEKLHCLLPINRRDLVNARFLLVTGLYTGLFIFFYLIMMLAQHLKLNYLIMGEDAEMVDIIGMIVKMSGGSFNELGLFNLLYFIVYAFGIIICTGSLKRYFKNSEFLSPTLSFVMKKVSKQEIVIGVIVLSILALWLLTVMGILPLNNLLSPIILLFYQLAQAANGFILGAAALTVAWLFAFCKYVSTVLEYEEKEL